MSFITVRSEWSSLRFRRARELSGAYVLSGIPLARSEAAFFRLFVLGCEFVSCGSSLSSKLVWVCFKSSATVAGRLALTVPCGSTDSPMFVSVESGRLLSGAAESRSRAAILSGRPSPTVAVQAGASLRELYAIADEIGSRC